MKTTEKIFDVNTGKETIIERELTAEEIAAHEQEQKLLAEAIKAKEEKERARQAILDKLGLTAEEATVLLG
jgi:hypothetical protein